MRRLTVGSLLAAAALALLAVTVGASGATAKSPWCMVINDRLNTTYFGDVQAAIDDAASGDTLWVRGACMGTFTITKSLTLTGQAKAGFRPPELHGDGSSSTVPLVHVSGSGIEVEINSLLLAGNGGYRLLYGGGILNQQSDLTLNGVTIEENGARWGAGIFNERGNLTVNHSTITNNSNGWYYGGGIFSVGGTLTLDTSTVASNTALRGAGIYVGYEDPSTRARMTPAAMFP